MQSINKEWLRAISHVNMFGNTSFPRGNEVKELLGFQTRTDLNDPILTIKARKLGYKFLAAEAAWILSGENRVATIAPYSKIISSFSDDGLTFHGAYGPKIRDQLHYVARILQEDPDSRQAVINIWRENPPVTRDVPCTLSIQFLIRDGYLHVIDTMRSSDLWLGWPYDAFNFNMLARYLLLYMKATQQYQLGELIMNMGSAHIYKRNYADINGIVDDRTNWETPGYTYDTNLGAIQEHITNPDVLIAWLWGAAKDGTLAPK